MAMGSGSWWHASSVVFGSAELVFCVSVNLGFREVLSLRATAKLTESIARDAFLRRGSTVFVCGGGTGGGLHSCARAEDGSDAPLDSVERLHWGAERWEALPSMKQRRSGAAGAIVDGCIYICGGGGGSAFHEVPVTCVLRNAERFDLVAEQWEAIPDMLEHRRGAVAAGVGGFLYICGGEGGETGEFILSSAESFNHAEGRWEPLPPMEGHRFGSACAALCGRLYVAGGSIGIDALSSSESFQPGSDCWVALQPMFEGRFGAIGAALHGHFYVCGGGRAERTLPSVERFCPKSGVWEAVAHLPLGNVGVRYGAGVVVAGRLMVCGGHQGRKKQAAGLRSVRLIDPSTAAKDNCRQLPSLCRGRCGAVVVRMLR
eukprot:TRINITY_DN65390_c0_g1_i1.p1 TRINITY_DN65390_c0_g1~~TRINITY_DN65390_c0_g1_i1.p1  ORF type:complete len:374 (-),score=61.25 TRINITY_DN65390_c0_g1_i1:113-1234(-)